MQADLRPIPTQAEREEKNVHGVALGHELDQAREQAAAEKKPILIDFTGVNCANCRLMEQARPAPARGRRRCSRSSSPSSSTPTSCRSTRSPPTSARSWPSRTRKPQLDLAKEATNPFYVVLTPDGRARGLASAATTSLPFSSIS